MKTFKQLFETGQPAADFKVKKDNDDEGKGEKSSAEDEENFKKKHKVDKKEHPVADDAQFKGKTKKDEGNADGEKKPLKTYKEMKEDISKAKKEDEDEVGDADNDDEDDVKKAKKKDDDEDEDEDEVVEGILQDLKKNSIILKDKKKTKIKLKPADSKALINALGKLTKPANKKEFETSLLKDKVSFDSMLDFAKQL